MGKGRKDKKETKKDPSDGGGVRVGACLGNGHKDKTNEQTTKTTTATTKTPVMEEEGGWVPV